MTLGRIARSMIRMVPVLTLGLSIGCLSGKSNWQRFIENTNTMIKSAENKYGCVGRGEGEIEMDSLLGDYMAEKMAESNANADYRLRCVDPKIPKVKIETVFVCGKQNYFDSFRERYFSTVAVCGKKD
jgi:hypothetical protein